MAYPKVPKANMTTKTNGAFPQPHCGYRSVAVTLFNYWDAAKEDPPFAAGESREVTTN